MNDQHVIGYNEKDCFLMRIHNPIKTIVLYREQLLPEINGCSFLQTSTKESLLKVGKDYT